MHMAEEQRAATFAFTATLVESLKEQGFTESHTHRCSGRPQDAVWGGLDGGSRKLAWRGTSTLFTGCVSGRTRTLVSEVITTLNYECLVRSRLWGSSAGKSPG